MIETLRNAWKIPELRKKLMFTALVLLLYRIGNVTIQPDNTQTRGKIAKIGYLLEVTEVE